MKINIQNTAMALLITMAFIACDSTVVIPNENVCSEESYNEDMSSEEPLGSSELKQSAVHSTESSEQKPSSDSSEGELFTTSSTAESSSDGVFESNSSHTEPVESSNDGTEQSDLLRNENRERETLEGNTLLATEDWRDSTRYIFHPDSLNTYELLIDDADLAYLDADPQREEYVPASIVFNGDTVSNVLVRYKGSKGAWTPCGDKAKICNLSTKVKFNTDGNKDRLFYGLKKLQFHSMNHSPSHLAERFAYWSYREMGLAASRTAYARLVINGALEGLFLLVEQVDGRFTRYHLNDDEGNVYKHYWPLMDSIKSTPDFLNEHLETNEEESDHTVVTAFEHDLAVAGLGKNQLASVLKKWDMADMIARQVVTATTVYDWDGPYLGAWDSGHNTYWAVLPKSEKIIMIPWDTDMPEFQGFMIGLVTQSLLWTSKSGYPGCPDKTTSLFSKAWFCFPDEYEEALVDIEKKVLSKRDQILTQWTEQIRPVMREIAETFPTGNANLYPSDGGYPWKAQTIKIWENSIGVYMGLLDTREQDLNKMRTSLDL